MKKVDIPMVKRNNSNEDKIDLVIKEANQLLKNNIITKDNDYSGLTYQEIIHEIYNKYEKYHELTKKDLIYIYDIYSYNTEYENEELNLLLGCRDEISDMATIFDCYEDQIATSASQLQDNNDYVVLLDTLNKEYLYNNKGLIDLSRLRYIAYSAFLDGITGPYIFRDLESIGGYADFYNFKYVKGCLKYLKSIGGDADFKNLTDATGLESLERIGNNANFYSLEDSTGLNKLTYIGGYAFFNHLKNARGLTNLKHIGGDASFNVLTSSIGLDNLECILGDANFSALEDITGFSSLTRVDGNIFLDKLNEQDKKILMKKLKK